MRNGLPRTVATTTLILALGVTMSADAGLFDHSMRWKEEVKLHDGQIIIAERFYQLGGYPGYDAQERMPLEQTVTFNLPNGKKIVWKTDFRDSVPEPNSLNHFRFDVVNGVPYLATYPAGCIAYNKWGRPNPPQVLFKHDGDQWKRITVGGLPSVLIGGTANVIVGRPASSLLKPFYTVKDVDDKNYYIRLPEYKTILREAVKGDMGCSEMIRTKDGGWEGLGFFRLQPTYAACLKYCEQKGVDQQTCPCKKLFRGERK